jgi:hypothetical protein
MNDNSAWTRRNDSLPTSFASVHVVFMNHLDVGCVARILGRRDVPAGANARAFGTRRVVQVQWRSRARPHQQHPQYLFPNVLPARNSGGE